MNNSNGEKLLASLRPGYLVTIRDDDGRTVTGRAYLHNGETLQVMLPAGHFKRPTSDNIVSIRPDTRDVTSAAPDAVPTMRETFGG